MSEFGALQNCLAVMEHANIELKQQNRDLVAALEEVKKRLRFAQFPSSTQGLLDIQGIIEQALAKCNCREGLDEVR